jgi:hypothetical protein
MTAHAVAVRVEVLPTCLLHQLCQAAPTRPGRRAPLSYALSRSARVSMPDAGQIIARPGLYDLLNASGRVAVSRRRRRAGLIILSMKARLYRSQPCRREYLAKPDTNSGSQDPDRWGVTLRSVQPALPGDTPAQAQRSRFASRGCSRWAACQTASQ